MNAGAISKLLYGVAFVRGDNLRAKARGLLDWPQSLKQFFINVSYYILEASLTLMSLF